MKLVRVGPPGAEKSGVLVDEEHFYDISAMGDLGEDFFRQHSLADITSYIKGLMAKDVEPHSIKGKRFGAPVTRPHQIICIGLNYADHAAETGAEIPSEPIIFTKSPNTLIGPNDDVRIPRKSIKTDWEVELAIVIGKQCRYLKDEKEALDHIAGYMISNDVSEREFQIERQGQWSKGKSSETFNPAGPWLVTPDEVGDPTNLSMLLTVNGQTLQKSSTAQMVYKPAFLVHYLSQFMVLEPGDIINTGTPPGVGMGQKPPRYLKPGDVMQLEIEGLGRQRQLAVAAP